MNHRAARFVDFQRAFQVPLKFLVIASIQDLLRPIGEEIDDGRNCILKLLRSDGAQVDAKHRWHWNAGQALSRIESGEFDYVVLQEQSTLPIKSAARMAESVRLFDAAIKRGNARTVLYMTWAREDAPETQQAISDVYETMGEELGALVVPVGRVWQKVNQNTNLPTLYDRDGSHPSLAGSYLAACVFSIRLFQLDIAELKSGPAGLSDSEREALQRAAFRFCRPKP